MCAYGVEVGSRSALIMTREARNETWSTKANISGGQNSLSRVLIHPCCLN